MCRKAPERKYGGGILPREMEYPNSRRKLFGASKEVPVGPDPFFFDLPLCLSARGRTYGQPVRCEPGHRAGGGFGTKTRARPVIGRGK